MGYHFESSLQKDYSSVLGSCYRITQSWGSQQPCHEDIQAAYGETMG